jgi:hypothetical protein
MVLKLSFLWFETTDNGDDTVTLEAVASVSPTQVPALLGEVTQVLAWAYRQFPGGPQPLDEGGEWDLLLQAQVNDLAPFDLPHSPTTGHVLWAPTPSTQGWVCVTFTVAGCQAFAQAWAQAAPPTTD